MNTKILALTLAALTLASFSACSKEETTTAEETTAAAVESVEGSNSSMIGNPWTDATQDDVKEKFGMTFGVPKDATDVIYKLNNATNTAEMQFTLNGTKWTARIAEAEASTDISGMYYVWSKTETQKLGKIEGTVKTATSDNTNVGAGLWFNEAQKLMYSLSGNSEKELDFSIASTVFPTK